MAVPANKEQLQKAITDNYVKLKRELSAITPEIAASAQLDGHSKGTLMSINDLVSYLIGWGRLVLKWNMRKDKSLPVDFPETGFKWNQLGSLAQKFYEDLRGQDYRSLLSELDSVFEQIEYLVECKTNEELYKVEWYEKWTLGRMIQFNTSSPYANTTSRLRKWKKSVVVNAS
jgi:hypothetical protein